ncbi:MAG: cysteine hydrolase family protein [Nitrospinota bacterium]
MDARVFSSLREKAAPNHTALIVVDVQNDFCAAGAWFDKMGKDLTQIQAMVPRLVDFIAAARRHGVRVIYVRLDYGEPFVSANMEERTDRKDIAAEPCQPGTWGADFYLVKPETDDLIVTKHRYDAFEGTDFDLILRSNGIYTLLVTGVTTECCVESTARTAFMKGYSVILVSDCTATYDPAFQHGTERIIEEYFGVVSPSGQIGEIWENSVVKGATA